jgi:hypothetical protein
MYIFDKCVQQKSLYYIYVCTPLDASTYMLSLSLSLSLTHTHTHTHEQTHMHIIMTTCISTLQKRTAVNLHTNCKMYKPKQPLCHTTAITAQAGSFSMHHFTTFTPSNSSNTLRFNLISHVTVNNMWVWIGELVYWTFSSCNYK